MAIAFGPIVAGPYTGTWNSVALGMTVEGFKLGLEWKNELINKSDLFADTLFDSLLRGCDGQITFECRTYAAGSTGPFWPWGGGTLGAIYTAAVPISTNARSLAQALVLTAVANTPAASAPATLTASKTLIAPNFRAELLFGPESRRVPLVLQLFPYEVSSNVLGLFVLG